MDRGIKDEGFIRRAFDFKDDVLDKTVSNQSYFNYEDDAKISLELKSSLIASVFVYIHKSILPENSLLEVNGLSTFKEVRKFIDKYADLTYSKK